MDLKDKIAWELTANGLVQSQAEAMAPVLVGMFEHHHKETIQYHQSEIDYWKQKCEEAEIDLMLEENKILKFSVPKQVTLKRRSNF